MSTKNILVSKIKSKKIITSATIWKLLSKEEITEITQKFGKTRVEKLYNWLYNIKTTDLKCKYCECGVVKFKNFIYGYQTFCTPKCATDWYREYETKEQKKIRVKKTAGSLNSKTATEWEIIKNKQKSTNNKKYGNPNFNNRKKQRETMKKKYGYSYALQVPTIKEKFKTTLKNKDWTESVELRKKTLLKTTGFEHQLQNPKIKKKIKETNIKKYGVENPSQCPQIAEKKLKSSYLKKEYILPSGKKELIQGYEDFEIDRLLTLYNESEISINYKDKPVIWYKYKGKECRYTPDIYIPKDNKIIEVKSNHTMKLHLKKNWLKKEKCVSLGYDFEFRIYDNKMNLLDEKDFLI